MRPNDTLKNLRPLIQKENSESNELEQFQNEVLRPILKLQHEIFQIEWSRNPVFEILQSIENPILQRSKLANLLSKTPGLVHRYIGMIIGLFSEEEFQFYLRNKNALDKRIKELLITRLLSY